jgi:DoxX-like family
MQLKCKPIYVEVPIRAEIERVWDASQKPDMHEQWDLRFSSITYLPIEQGKPQEFVYSRTVGPFLEIEGWGQSVGSFHKDDGTRSSSLHFGTDQWISPIREGRGYWKYEPQDDHVKFLTQYDYNVNFGKVGEVMDKIIFRPLIGWATALSFDVLKRWLEQGEAPRSQYMRFFSTYLMTLLFAFIWMYQGLIPKIISMHPEERAMTGSALSLSENGVTTALLIIGIAEVLFGIAWLLYQRKRHLFILQLILLPLLTITAVTAVPTTTSHPFNPITFNLSLIVLSIIGLLVSKDIPSSTSCKRKR